MMSSYVTKKVLDHGFVHLRDSMPKAVPVDPEVGLGEGDYRVEEAARVSTSHLPDSVRASLGIYVPGEDDPLEVRTAEQTKKLLTFMFKNGHTTPFEQVRFTWVIKLPIFVARQWIRHRTGSFNEQSARYSVLPCEFYVPTLERMQAQSTANKQGSAEPLLAEYAHGMINAMRTHSEGSYHLYENLLKGGLTRELARIVLPTNFYTEWYWTTDLHNLMHFLSKRCALDSQFEIRVYANAMLEMAALVAPFTISLFREKYGVPHA